MDRFVYLALLLACVVAPLTLELTLAIGLVARFRRLVVTVVPIAILFSALDAVAVDAHLWSYSGRWLIGPRLADRLPIEEVLFFIVVPVCAVASLEAVRRCRPNWTIGDEVNRP